MENLFGEDLSETALSHKFIRNTKYYGDGEVVYEFNLPSGHACPGALVCKVKVDRKTGKFSNDSKGFRCYAAMAERFPSARESRWKNFEYVKSGNIPILPALAKKVRIHASGDFFSQEYFDMWLDVARNNPTVEFWAYTKSINFLVKRLDVIPDNLTITASKGSRFDILIDMYNLKSATVVNPNNIKFITKNTAYYKGKIMPIDYGDDQARKKDISFLLLDNHTKLKNKDDKDTSTLKTEALKPVNNENLFSINGFELKKFRSHS